MVVGSTILRQLRFSSTSSSSALRSLYPEARILVKAESKYGMRKYRLEQKRPLQEDDDDSVKPTQLLASIVAHRNVVFGAKSHVEGQSIATLCTSLLERALDDCVSVGDQPQALSTLHGLTAYVQSCLDEREESVVLNEIRQTKDADDTVFEAVKAIATGIPRPGHSVVGAGTHRDAGTAWERLAKEFIQKSSQADECALYQNHGGELVGIELLADTNPDYLKSAGGAMARFFFLDNSYDVRI